MIQLAILLSTGPDQGVVTEHALGTIETALAHGHAVFVFCYGDGTAFGRIDRDIPQGETDHVLRLHDCANHDQCRVVACITAAERRGLTAEALAPGIRLAGLGEWTEAVIESDRVVQFQ